MKLPPKQKDLGSIIVILLLILFSGTLVFMRIEGWHFIDALYFATATLTTVGFGDVVPVTYIGKLFGVLYMWIGVTVALYSIAYIGGHIIKKKLHRDAPENQKQEEK